jgi:type VI secretion system secreted protein VgrG
MAYLSKELFRFTSSVLPADTFGVVDFHGVEGLSRLYEFTVNLVAGKLDIDFQHVLDNPATFSILREQGDEAPFHGYIRELDLLHAKGDLCFYRAVLVPKLWWLTLTHHNQVVLDQASPHFLKEVLEDGGLSANDFQFRLSHAYEKWEYVCQYRETHYNFFARWLEREGMYYFFEQDASHCKLIVTDTRISHTDLPQGKTLRYATPSGLEYSSTNEVVRSFSQRLRLTPGSVVLKDYNYRTPSLDLTGEAQVTSSGQGQVYIYGDHFRTPSEGQRLAELRAEELRCRRERYHGESLVPHLRPGYVFTLDDHFKQNFNQDYLAIEVSHHGSQAAYLLAGISLGGNESEKRAHYENAFVAIPANLQYRSELKTEKPRFHGTLNAKIDAASSGQYAELDEHGRYKVILPFDQSGRSQGHASSWLRMMQPYAGANHGMHFPLHKGVEVVLAFVDGDPDRPYIAGAMTNPDNPNQVTAYNQTQSRLTTAGGNNMHIEDAEGSQRILMQSPSANTWVRMGAPNDPPSAGADDDDVDSYVKKGWESFKESGYAVSTEGPFELHVGGVKLELTIGALITDIAIIANKFEFTGGASEELLLGGKIDCHWPEKWTLTTDETETKLTKLETSVEDLSNTVDKIDLAGTEQKLRTEITKVEALANKAQTEVTSLKANEIKALGEEIKTTASSINTKLSEVESKANQVSDLANKIETVGNNVKTVATVMQNVASEFKQTGTYIHTAGTSLKNAGAIISNGLHLQN